jgi:hypothetical protein
MRSHRFDVFLPVLVLLVAGCQADRGNQYPPVTVAQLAGCHYSPEASHGTRFGWSFDPAGFRVVADTDPIPSALLAALVGTGIPARKVEGRWTIAGDDLVLTELSADGRAISGSARLRIWNHGVIRVSLPADADTQFAFSR